MVAADNSAIEAAYPSIPIDADQLTAITSQFAPFIEAKARPAFLYDPESHTPSELAAYLKRELSLRMRKAFVATYEFMGHTLNGQVPAVDTIINLVDQRPSVNWNGNLWILGRRFWKDPRSGTRTRLTMCIPGSIQF
jgi:hypothetical protein